MTTALANYVEEDEITIAPTRILERIGTPDERRILIAVMAEQLGIPASEASQPEVIAVIANAAQRTVQFGWQPGVHMHVQSFNETVDGVKRKKWVLVDGEKAWKDSAARWRERGVEFAMITRPQLMTRDEILKEAKAMGMPPEDVHPGACGVYAKVVVISEFEINAKIFGREVALEYIPWACGMWTGKKRVGRYWNEDALNTGVTAKDVALRRAHKRAYMQSTLTLIPLDSRTEMSRLNELTEAVRREAGHRQKHAALPAPRTLDDFDREQLYGDAPAHTNGADPAGQSDLTPDQMAQEFAHELVAEPAADNPFDDPTAGVSGEANIDYGAIADRLTGTCKTLAEWAYKLHHQGDGPASKAQYGYLTKAIDDHTKDGHTLVLSVLCRRHVTSDNPCSKNLAAKLLDVLLQRIPQKDANGKSVKGTDGKVVYVDNPKYRPDVVECVKGIAALQ